MPDRRAFIQLAAGAALVPRLAWAAPGGASAAARLPVIVDGDCALVASVVAHCGLSARNVDGPLAIVDALAPGDLPGLFGLTRDSCAFVVKEMAAALGYRLAYRGIHSGGSFVVEHAPPTDAPWLTAFAHRLEDGAGAWPDDHRVSWYLRRV